MIAIRALGLGIAMGMLAAGGALGQDFRRACIDANASSPMGEAAVAQYCGCLEKNLAASGDPALEGKIAEVMSLPRDQRRAAIDGIPGANAVISPCVQQMRGG